MNFVHKQQTSLTSDALKRLAESTENLSSPRKSAKLRVQQYINDQAAVKVFETFPSAGTAHSPSIVSKMRDKTGKATGSMKTYSRKHTISSRRHGVSDSSALILPVDSVSQLGRVYEEPEEFIKPLDDILPKEKLEKTKKRKSSRKSKEHRPALKDVTNTNADLEVDENAPKQLGIFRKGRVSVKSKNSLAFSEYDFLGANIEGRRVMDDVAEVAPEISKINEYVEPEIQIVPNSQSSNDGPKPEIEVVEKRRVNIHTVQDVYDDSFEAPRAKQVKQDVYDDSFATDNALEDVGEMLNALQEQYASDYIVEGSVVSGDGLLEDIHYHFHEAQVSDTEEHDMSDKDYHETQGTQVVLFRDIQSRSQNSISMPKELVFRPRPL